MALRCFLHTVLCPNHFVRYRSFGVHRLPFPSDVLDVQFFSDMTINEYHLDDAAEYLGGVDDLAE